MRQKKDIGQIINSKLETKYNDDFFDTSKGWDALMVKLPQKGFWNWGFTHVNIYYVAFSLLLLTTLFYVGTDNEKSEKTNTTLSIGDDDEGSVLNTTDDNNSNKKNTNLTYLLKTPWKPIKLSLGKVKAIKQIAF